MYMCAVCVCMHVWLRRGVCSVGNSISHSVFRGQFHISQCVHTFNITQLRSNLRDNISELGHNDEHTRTHTHAHTHTHPHTCTRTRARLSYVVYALSESSFLPPFHPFPPSLPSLPALSTSPRICCALSLAFFLVHSHTLSHSYLLALSPAFSLQGKGETCQLVSHIHQ